jgi:quercetin dioxygenase-like cupin family protein
MKKVKTKVNFKDVRGTITDLLVGEKIDTITLITSVKGAVRANHYHKKTVQYDYIISGLVECKTKALPDGKVVTQKLKAGDLLFHPANEAHALKALEDSVFLSVTCGPRRGGKYESDTYRLEKPLIK